MDEKEFIGLLKNKDESAFKTLVSTYKNLIANITYKFFFNLQDTEDITQEVFIEIFNSISRFNEKSSLKSWIYKITVSKSIDRIRSQKRQKRFHQVISIFGKEFEDFHNQIADNSNPHNLLENKEDLNELILKINELPENQRIALTLSKLNSISQKEVSEIMQITEGAVEALVFRAKKKLKLTLNKS
jgi:RNA polymerase sigma-70 factor (ECF subfamily)